MSFDLKSISRSAGIKAPRVLLYSVAGLGKTTFCANAPKPIFCMTEDGIGQLEVDHFPLCKSLAEVTKVIETLITEDHDYQTFCLDSADWTEALIVSHVEANHSEKELSYGKDQMLIAQEWRTLLDGMTILRDQKGMAILITAHSQIKRFDAPEGDSYDRYMPKLSKGSGAVVQEFCDCVLFANFEVKTRTVETKAGDRKIGISNGARMLFTTETPAYVAKNRYSLPEKLPLAWDSFVAAMNQPSN